MMNKITLTMASLSLIMTIGFIAWSQLNATKTAYVNNFEIFDQFKGKKELQAKLVSYNNETQYMLDSITVEIQNIKAQLNQNPKGNAQLVKNLQIKEHTFLQLNQYNQSRIDHHGQQFTEEIWKQINQYVIDYGKANGYDYIYGTSANGTIMYGTEGKNITKEVLHFINQRYEGL